MHASSELVVGTKMMSDVMITLMKWMRDASQLGG